MQKEDETFNTPQSTIRPQEREMSLEKNVEPEQMEMQEQYHQVEGVRCPNCGAMNDSDAMYCASCGEPLRKAVCPNCGAEIDPGADYCEKCHHYIKNDTCSFCGAHLSGDEAYCPECGSPRGGIVCPVCHTLNEFAFCKQCGTPLTEGAKAMMVELQSNPEYMEITKLASEYAELSACLPINGEHDMEREKMSEDIRIRVLHLLAKDKGDDNPEIESRQIKRITKDELKQQKETLASQLTTILEKLSVPVMQSSAKARNFAMACKPGGVRVGWLCNYQHAVHSSPCGCAKPQMGGKWIILGKNHNTKDDK